MGGLDLGGTKIQAIVLDGRNSVLAEARHATPTDGGPKAVIDELAATLADACAQADLEPARLAGVGVGSPGAVDPRRGVVKGARNLPGEGAPIRIAAGLGKLTGTPVYVDNDVTVGVYAEYALGAARRAKSLLGVWWGTGVGGGLVLDGKRWEGRGTAGELGTSSSRWMVRAAHADATAASRPMPAVGRWSSEPAASTSGGARPICSGSWRSAAAPG